VLLCAFLLGLADTFFTSQLTTGNPELVLLCALLLGLADTFFTSQLTTGNPELVLLCAFLLGLADTFFTSQLTTGSSQLATWNLWSLGHEQGQCFCSGQNRAKLWEMSPPQSTSWQYFTIAWGSHLALGKSSDPSVKSAHLQGVESAVDAGSRFIVLYANCLQVMRMPRISQTTRS
jgi:hypothetical protein